jgi:hypothetical protein
LATKIVFAALRIKSVPTSEWSTVINVGSADCSSGNILLEGIHDLEWIAAQAGNRRRNQAKIAGESLTLGLVLDV